MLCTKFLQFFASQSVKERCPVTCNACPASDCKDLYSECTSPFWTLMCSTQEKVRKTCPESCGLCSKDVVKVPGVCRDEYSGCMSLVTEGWCTADPSYMEEHCIMSCSFCVDKM